MLFVWCCAFGYYQNEVTNIGMFIFKNNSAEKDTEKSFANYFLWMDDPCNLWCFVMFILRTWTKLYQTKHTETNFIEETRRKEPGISKSQIKELLRTSLGKVVQSFLIFLCLLLCSNILEIYKKNKFLAITEGRNC